MSNARRGGIIEVSLNFVNQTRYRSMFIRPPIAVMICCLLFATANGYQSTESPENSAAETLAQEATRLQNANQFAQAANQWEKLITNAPRWQRIGMAHLNLGVCKVSQGKFTEAFAPLKQSLKLSGSPVDTPKALMFLGYAQMNHGNQLSMSQSTADLEESAIYLTTATRTLGKIVNGFPNFELADQAIYFRGQCFYKLDRLNEAIAAFEKVTEMKDATFRKEAFFDMANSYQRQDEFALAQDAYESYFSIAQTQAQENPAAFLQARLRTANAKLALAANASDKNETGAADALYKSVIEILQPISADAQSTVRDQALFNQALAVIGLGDAQRAIDLLQSVAALPDSQLAQQANVLAGRELIGLKRYDGAMRILRPIAQSDSRFGVEAAILLSTALRMTNQPQPAVEIATRWVNNAPNSALIATLLMEQADAHYMIPGQKDRAAEIYTKIAMDYPQSTVAGDAMYKAAAANWETYQTPDAIALAKRFTQQFPQHRRVAAAQSILADAAIAEKDFHSGESIYRDLVRDYPDDPDVSRWTLRIGWALFLQGKFAQSRDFLSQRVDTIERSEDQSEAFHWIGESAYELKNYRNAISALNQSLESATPWDRLDATLFTRLQSELALGNSEDALATVNLLQQEFPDSKLVGEALLRTGEAYLQQQKFPEAIAQYKKVISQHPDSKLLPSALYGLGWAQLRSGQFEIAETTFEKLISDFPAIDLSQQARVGRSIAQRRLGKTDSAITDLKAFIKSAPSGERKNNSLLELGLAYVENEAWKAAEATFTELLAIQPATSLADRAHYELAWVLKQLDKPDLALQQFTRLIEDHPNSVLSAGAYYEVAADLYQRKQFREAAEMFQRALDNKNEVDPADDGLVEKALYQLAWSQYQLKDFPSAAKTFSATAEQYPQSDRVGDALFMKAQSYFQLDNFADALSAYQMAETKLRGVSMARTPQKRLLLLHGSQSANQISEFQTAIDLATPLTVLPTDGDDGPDSALIHSAWLEIGKARLGFGEIQGALDALERSSQDLGRTGAQARVIKGDILLQQEEFEAAINEYKLVFYGYGGTQSTDEIRALQAYAIYETARASYTRIKNASPQMKTQLIQQALKHFRYLVTHYPDQPLAEQAQVQITTIENLQQEP